MSRSRASLATGLVAVALALLLTGCGDDAATPAAGSQADSVTVSDAWVKATDEEMTAAFGRLANGTDTDVTLVGATTDVATMVEVHEVAMIDGAMVMQPKEGGVTVRAGATAVLEPGGDHLMLMSVTGPIRPGDQITITLEFSDGSTQNVTATAKHFTGGNEDYSPGPD